MGVVLTRLALLMPAFSLPSAPAELTLCLHCRRERSPTDAKRHLIASVAGLSPATFSARNHSTSELLRTL